MGQAKKEGRFEPKRDLFAWRICEVQITTAASLMCSLAAFSPLGIGVWGGFLTNSPFRKDNSRQHAWTKLSVQIAINDEIESPLGILPTPHSDISPIVDGEISLLEHTA